MGLRVTGVMGFISANFRLHMPFCSRLSVRYGTDRRTDRQTTASNGLLLCPAPYRVRKEHCLVASGHNRLQLEPNR